MKFVTLLFLLSGFLHNPNVHITCNDSPRHFSLNARAVVEFRLESVGTSDSLIDDGAVLSLASLAGEQFTAPFNVHTLEPSVSKEEQRWFTPNPKKPLIIKVDLSALKWGQPTLSTWPRQPLKVSVAPGFYELRLIVIAQINGSFSLIKSNPIKISLL
jgi:hypothetical protein